MPAQVFPPYTSSLPSICVGVAVLELQFLNHLPLSGALLCAVQVSASMGSVLEN